MSRYWYVYLTIATVAIPTIAIATVSIATVAITTLIDTCRHDDGMVAARAMACRQNAIMYVRI